MAAKKSSSVVNPLVKTLYEEIEKRGLTIPEFAVIAKIPKDRIYKWKQQGTAPKDDDAKIVRAWLKNPTKMDINPNEELIKEKNPDKFRALLIERLSQLEANVRALNTTVINLKHRVTGESEAKISLELEKTTQEVGDIIHDELKKLL